MNHQCVGNSLPLFERREQPVRVPTRKHLKTFVNFLFCDQTEIGQGSSIQKKSLFTTVLITNNGRLDQRAWLRNDILEDWLKVV